MNLQKTWELRREEIESGRSIAERVQPRKTMMAVAGSRTDAHS